MYGLAGIVATITIIYLSIKRIGQIKAKRDKLEECEVELIGAMSKFLVFNIIAIVIFTLTSLLFAPGFFITLVCVSPLIFGLDIFGKGKKIMNNYPYDIGRNNVYILEGGFNVILGNVIFMGSLLLLSVGVQSAFS